MSTRDVEVDPTYTGGPVGKILVVALLENELHDSRVIIERAFANTMQSSGVDATAGYVVFDNLDEIAPSRWDEELAERGVEAVLFVDPIRLDTTYDPGDYARRRSAYRALGYDDSAAINLLAQIARDASAAKVVMNVDLTLVEGERDLFLSTYDINAPGNYETAAAREYSNQFAEAVLEDLRDRGLVE